MDSATPHPRADRYAAPDPLPAIPPPDALVDTITAARIVGLSRATLETWRSRGGGPAFRKVGARVVRYRVRDLLEFVEAGARSSTSDCAA